jgi:hypothetical protein
MLTRDEIVSLSRDAIRRTTANETGIAPPNPKHAERLKQLKSEQAPTAGAGETSAEKLKRLIAFIVDSIDRARASETPFYHLEFDRVFPDDIYAAMLREMPGSADYRALPGRDNVNILEDGTATRVKIDLFPEYVRNMPASKRELWTVVGKALCSREVRDAFVRRLAPALERRFGPNYRDIGMFPIPILTRDVPKYRITPHTDTKWKGITVQFYLPPDDSTKHIGTIFHERRPDGSMPKAVKMPFSPNTGYAFAVGSDTWHSADPVGPEVKTRDSILHTYFVDAGVLRKFRNRSRRVGNFIANEMRSLVRS